MEQQKTIQNIDLRSNSYIHLTDISNANQKSHRSYHNLSHSNINSKVRLIPAPQVFISYNFENDQDIPIRTHNLLLGLDSFLESSSKKKNYRVNPLSQQHYISNSNSKLNQSKNQSNSLRAKLIQVRSNQILSNKRRNDEQNVQSLYEKNEKTKINPQSFKHLKTFWNQQSKGQMHQKKIIQERLINGQISKISQQKSFVNKPGIFVNPIQKHSRNKKMEIERVGEDKANQDKENNENKNTSFNYITELQDKFQWEKIHQNRLAKPEQNQYNQKTEKLLKKLNRKSKKKILKQDLQPSINQNSRSKSKDIRKNKLYFKLSDILLKKQSRIISKQKISDESEEKNKKEQQQHANDENNNGKIQNSPSRQDNEVQQQMRKYQKRLIQKQNLSKPKRKFHQLLRNNSKYHQKYDFEEFHRIQSEHENQLDSNQKFCDKQLKVNDPCNDKSVNYSINEHIPQNDANDSQTNSAKYDYAKVSLDEKGQPQNNNFSNRSNNSNKKSIANSVEGQKSDSNSRFEKIQKTQMSEMSNRQKINSTIYKNLNTISNDQKSDFLTKRNVPVTHEQFLRMLSQESERKKSIEQIEQLQKQKQAQICPKYSRFKSLEDQNEHIKRVLTPIRNSRLQDRRKKPQGEKQANTNGINAQKNAKFDSESFKISLFKSIEKIRDQNGKNNLSKFDENSFTDTQGITGVKIPERAIEQSKLRRNIKTNLKRDSLKNSRNNSKDQNYHQNQKITKNQQVKKSNTTAKENGSKINQLNLTNKAEINQNLNNFENSKGRNTTPNKINEITPVDKRFPIDQQKNFKNWRSSQGKQKIHKEELLHQKKEKIIKEKDWKSAEEQSKQKKLKEKRGILKQKQGQTANKNKQQSSIQQLNQKQVSSTVQQNFEQMPENHIQNANEEQKARLPQELAESQINQHQQKIDSKNFFIDNQADLNQENQENFLNKNNTETSLTKNDLIDNQQATLIKDTAKNSQILEKQSKKSLTQSLLPHITVKEQLIKQVQIKTLNQNSLKTMGDNEKQDAKFFNPPAHIKTEQNNIIQNEKNQNKQNPFSKMEIQNINKKNSPIISEAKNGQKTLKNQIFVQNQKEKNETSSQKLVQKKKNQIKKDIDNQIERMLENKEMKQKGFMQITESKFELYNHSEEKSVIDQSNQREVEQQEKRAQIVKYLYQLPAQYESEITNFIPNANLQSILKPSTFRKINLSLLKDIKLASLRNALKDIFVFEVMKINIQSFKSKSNQKQQNSKMTIRKLFQPYPNVNQQLGIWLYCVGVWRLIKLNKTQLKQNQPQFTEEFLIGCLQTCFIKAIKQFYSKCNIAQIKKEEILRMLTGLRISTLSKGKAADSKKIFKQIDYNTRKSHIIHAIPSQDSKFLKDTVSCIRKIQCTPIGEKLFQVVSVSFNQIQLKPKYYWIKQGIFLEFFSSFIIISTQKFNSFWTNKEIQIKNQDKAVYLIDSTENHTSGSITLYPLNSNFKSSKSKCTIAFYKQIEPQVLKLVGKAIEKLPQNQSQFHLSKLYFEFNIKGAYYIFLQLQDGKYNVSIESNSIKTDLHFAEFVKKQSMKNDQCEYVEIDKIFKKKQKINIFQNSNEFKKLLNFMKKTNHDVYKAE